MKRFMSICSLAMCIVILSGCGAKNVANNYGSNGQPLELTVHMHFWNRIVFDDNWEVFKKAAEITNIRLKGTASKTATDSRQVFNIMMASGDLPDIIHLSKGDANKYGEEGALIPLNDLIQKHAPNITRIFEQYPEYKKHVTSASGNIYCLSTLLDGEAAAGYFIRKDWLDKLGLKIPQTVDEYYNVLKAFRENDPNENGIKDEVPFFGRGSNEPLRIINLYGAKTGWYIENGKVYHGQYDDVYKTAMIELVKWYDEGLIDNEIYTRGSKARDEILGKNAGGSTHDWFASTAAYNDTLKDKIPGFSFIPIAPPADINGKRWEEQARNLYGENAWGISYKNKYPIETIKYFDFWFSEEGRRLMNFGIENVDYTLVDGQPKFTNVVLDAGEPVLSYLNKKGAQIEIGFHQDFNYEKQWLNDIAREGVELYLNGNFILPQFPSLSFTKEETAIMEEKWPAIRTYINEMTQKWILRASSPEADFDTYKTTLKNMGIEEIIQIHQNAYDRQNNR